MPFPSRRLLLPALLPALLAVTAPARAQDAAAAAALFDRGMADMKAGRYETGCKAIAESQRLDPRPGTLFTLAVCESQWGRTASAMVHFQDYLSLYESLPPDQKARQTERPKVAKAQREALAREVPELTLTLAPGAPAGTVVKRDGSVMAEAALGVALPVDPGEHVLTTQAPGGPVWEQRITIGKGEKKQIPLEVKLASVAAPPVKTEAPPPSNPAPLPPSADSTGPSGRRIAAYAVGGVGVAGLALAGVTGGLALGTKGTIAEHCGSKIGSIDEAACDAAGLEAASSGKTLALVSSVGLGVGIAGLATAVVLIVTEPAQPKPAEAKRKPWISASVLDAGPAGALIGVRGGW